MAKYMVMVKYAPEGAAAVLDGGAVARREQTAAGFGVHGITIEGFWMCVDPEYDAFFVFDGPDNPALFARFDLETVAGGRLAHSRMHRLIDPEELDAVLES